MIRRTETPQPDFPPIAKAQGARHALLRFGAIPQVVRVDVPDGIECKRGENVVLETERGIELADILNEIRDSSDSGDTSLKILRTATPEDQETFQRHQHEATASFAEWQSRIVRWNLTLQLIDLEQTLDGKKTILYVLSDRNSDCTMLALYAAAEGLAAVDVTPVNSEGVVMLADNGGGCGCGSGGCSTS